jgi:hypothetical protein
MKALIRELSIAIISQVDSRGNQNNKIRRSVNVSASEGIKNG